MNLKSFSRLQECPKCLSKYTEKKFYYAGDNAPQYINVTCSSCGYSWNMKTADSGKELILEEKPFVGPDGADGADNLPEEIPELVDLAPGVHDGVQQADGGSKGTFVGN